MAHTIILFDDNGLRSSAEDFNKGNRLLIAGYPVQRTRHEKGRVTVTTKMWIDFETESEAAIFKLTHL